MSSEVVTEQFALEVEGLSKRYRSRLRGTKWALRDCSFAIPAGSVVALVGLNGAGKTTLLSMLAGLLTPTEGHVGINEERGGTQRVSFVAQEKPLYRHFSVRDMLRLGARLNQAWDENRALRWLNRFDIPLDRRCGKLSGGQQAHVAFAIAISARPSVLLLDEPLANLDPLARRDVTQELLGEVADTGMTVMLSTHVVTELGGVADHLLLMANGRLLVNSDADDLLGEHFHYIGPRSQCPPVPGEIVHASHTSNQSRFVVRLPSGETPPAVSPPWTIQSATLEDIALAYLESSNTRLATAA